MLNLSIIIPVYNGEKYLKECLDSILQAKDESFEVLILNDGSKDTTNQICKEYAKKDKRIVYIDKEKNSGVSDTRNQGILRAKGKWIMFVDCDDLLNEKWNETIKESINSKEDIIYFTTHISNNKSKRELLDSIFYITKNAFITPPFSKLYKTDFIKANELFFKRNVINGEDMLYNTAALLKCKDYKIINKSIYKYRITAGSITHSFNKKIFESDKNFHIELEQLNKMHTEDLTKYMESTKENALYMFTDRLSFISLKEAKKYYGEIKKISATTTINRKAKFSFKKICIFLIKKNFITTTIILIKFKSIIKRILKKNNKTDYLVNV